MGREAILERHPDMMPDVVEEESEAASPGGDTEPQQSGTEPASLYVSPLGSAYSRRVERGHGERVEWRKRTPRPDVSQVNIEGTTLCRPFSTLRVAGMAAPPLV